MIREPMLAPATATIEMRQASLPGVENRRVKSRAEEFDEAALRFLNDNPIAWKLFVHYSVQAIHVAGKVAAKQVVERLRWEVAYGDSRFAIESSTGDSFKFNNNHPASFARIFEATFPEHRGAFTKRVRKSEKKRARDA